MYTEKQINKDEENAQNLLAHYITAKNIITIVEKHTGINIREQTRKREVTDARQIAIYLIKENTSLSYRQTACACGLQSHSTAWHACNQVKNHMSFNHDFKNKYEDLINFTYKHKNIKTIANDLRTHLQNHYHVAAIEAEHIKNAAKAEEDLTEAIERLEQTNKKIKIVTNAINNL